MDDRTKRIVELVRAGLSSEEVARVFEVERVLDATDAVTKWMERNEPQPTNGTPNKHLLMAPAPVTPRLASPPESLHEVVNELISDEDWNTAPVGSCWELPMARLQHALKGCKTDGEPRSKTQAVGAAASFLRSRGKDCSAQQEDGGRICLITKKAVV